MKSLMAFSAIILALIQFLTYLVTKLSYQKLTAITGKIVKAKLEDYSGVDGNRVYKASFEIEYEYNDTVHLCSSPILRSFELFPAFKFESSLLDHYKAGDSVEVKLDPRKPSNCYIAVTPLSITSTLAMLVAALVGVLYLIYLDDRF